MPEFRATMTQAYILAQQLEKVLEAASYIIDSDEFPSLDKDCIIAVCSKNMSVSAYIQVSDTVYLRCSGDFTHDTYDLITLEPGETLMREGDAAYTIRRIRGGDEFMVSTTLSA